MGAVSMSSDLNTMPVDAATAFRDAIRSARVAIATLEPWLETQSRPTQAVFGRAISWWKRCLTMTESTLLQSPVLPEDQ
jgi:hypothetical protein